MRVVLRVREWVPVLGGDRVVGVCSGDFYHLRTIESACDKISKQKEFHLLVQYESINRNLQTRPIYECRCDERLKTKAEESTFHVYTELIGELEHLMIE